MRLFAKASLRSFKIWRDHLSWHLRNIFAVEIVTSRTFSQMQKELLKYKVIKLSLD